MAARTAHSESTGSTVARVMSNKDRKHTEAERAVGYELRDLVSEAVEQGLQLAPEVADAASAAAGERAIDLPFRSADDAVFARKRINEALAVAEWADEVTVWVWRKDRHSRAALTERGQAVGWELRLEQPASAAP